MHRSKQFIFCGLVFLISAAAIARVAPARQDRAQGVSNDCSRSLLFNFEDTRYDQGLREVPVWQIPSTSVFFFETGMTIDADGAPNAYNAENTGLDDLENAGVPGHWQGVVQDENGDPFVQGADDPFPGFYVSCTALFDRTKSRINPARYIDASKIPYIVLPGEVARQTGARLGDFAIVSNPRNGKSSYAIFGDIGTMGEGSVALARNLGISDDARRGGTRGRIRYMVFVGSGNGQPRSVEEINREAEKQLRDGGAGRFDACTSN